MRAPRKKRRMSTKPPSLRRIEVSVSAWRGRKRVKKSMTRHTTAETACRHRSWVS